MHGRVRAISLKVHLKKLISLKPSIENAARITSLTILPLTIGTSCRQQSNEFCIGCFDLNEHFSLNLRHIGGNQIPVHFKYLNIFRRTSILKKFSL